MDERLTQCMLRDRPALARLEGRIRRREQADKPADRDRRRFEQRLIASVQAVRRRAEQMPPISLPPALPISDRATDIREACRTHQVVIVAGETGSGKTTQLPKLLLQEGHGIRGMVGCTQPRRLAAMTMAARVAEELQDGDRRRVGYQVRFDQRTTSETLIKFMTDGILLAETRSDPDLLAYDALLIDEAHERSLNIDFLLGYLRRLLPRRPELRVVVSSATLDVERLAAFFDAAPIVRVEGRGYPVEVRYRPSEEDSDLSTEVARAVEEALRGESTGDGLVFLSGERDIREAARVLEGRLSGHIEVLPLYSRLPAEEQRKVFRTGTRRRVILSTNVAETSVTVPGIRWVVDAGWARVRRYHHRTQVEKLHVEPISQASAEQRKGRCGRIAPGICIRLYDEADLARRSRFTDPEIKRSSLASVILTMQDLGLGDVADFPFLDPPNAAMIREGYRELHEIGAMDARRELTPLGRRLARFPIEPRLARVVVEGGETGLLPEALVLVAALSVDDPRLRPAGREQAADEAHASLASGSSDFRVFLELWEALQRARQAHPSLRRFNGYCRRGFLSARRVAEWESLRQQLEDRCRDEGLPPEQRPPEAKRAGDAALHRMLLTGFMTRIGRRQETGGYRGIRDITFTIHPRSCLADAAPEWVVATEFVETSRLFARTVGPVQPAWVEAAAAHLVQRDYGPPFWDARTGFVRAEETVRLHGLTLIRGRHRHFGPIDPEQSRRVFLQHALVEGELDPLPDVLRRNRELAQRLADWEARARRLDLLIPASDLVDLYHQRVPPGIVSARAFRRWMRSAGDEAVRRLSLTEKDLLLRSLDDVTPEAYPDELSIPGGRFPLRYAYAPGEPADGITCRVPHAALPSLPAARLDWLVPGRLPEKIGYLLKGLPKRYRRELVPLPQAAEAAQAELGPADRPLTEALSDWALRRRGVHIPSDAWPTELPHELTMRIEVIGPDGDVLAEGRDITALARRLPEPAAASPPSGCPWDRRGVTEWEFGELPVRIRGGSEAWPTFYFPGLVDEGTSITLRLFACAVEARRATTYGLARLALLALPSERRRLRGLAELSSEALLDQVVLGLGDVPLRDHIVLRAVADAAGFSEDPIPRTADAFIEQLYARKRRFPEVTQASREQVQRLLSDGAALWTRLESLNSPAAEDMRGQLRGLLTPGFVLDTPPAHWPELPRYLQGMAIRLERRRLSAAKDDRKAEEMTPYLGRHPPKGGDPAAWVDYRWMLEEWRISLFAQELGTRFPVSAKRLDAQWARVQTGATDQAPRPRTPGDAPAPSATTRGGLLSPRAAGS